MLFDKEVMFVLQIKWQVPVFQQSPWQLCKNVHFGKRACMHLSANRANNKLAVRTLAANYNNSFIIYLLFTNKTDLQPNTPKNILK